MPIFNSLDFLKLNDVIYNFNNPVCKNILFPIFMEDFSTKIASKTNKFNSAAGVSGLTCD